MQNTTNGRGFQGFGATVRAHRWWFLGLAAAGLLLRFWFVFHLMMVTPDSLVYGELANNWVQHHVYGIGSPEGPIPVDMRLPGYPAYLALCFLIAGVDHYRAACIGQVFVDLGTCFLIAALALRISGARAARWAFALSALCPFLINYVSTALTETWEIFFTVAALLLAVEGAERLEKFSTLRQKRPDGWATQTKWAWCGLAIGAATLLRPDGGMILIALLLWLGWKFLRARGDGGEMGRRPLMTAAVVVTAFTFVPLVPWAIRNAITLHAFQPLAPVDANVPGEYVPHGFNRWLKSWEMDYASQEDIGFNVSGEEIPFDRVPNRAFDNSQQRQRTEELFREYNQTLVLPPELDTQFDALARERIADSPARYYLELPVLRALDMWLRPRTEMLPVSIHWWTFRDPHDSAIAIFLGLWNLALVGAAAWALRGFGQLRFAGMLLVFVAVRTVLIVALSIPEPRYVLECYPVVLALAGAAVAGRRPRVKDAVRGS
jgi:hypothetical protein